jgi:hypothetical protein
MCFGPEHSQSTEVSPGETVNAVLYITPQPKVFEVEGNVYAEDSNGIASLNVTVRASNAW